MNEEDFSAWKDSVATKWFFDRLRAHADKIISATAQNIINTTGSSPPDWAVLQVRAAYDKGCSDAIYSMTEKEFSDFDEE